jgi:hypothetical protein
VGKPCKYCGQSGTHKDEFGFCKKYNCFEVSGTKEKIEKLERRKLHVSTTYPTYKRNQFDGIPYNPREDELRWINKQIGEAINF